MSNLSHGSALSTGILLALLFWAICSDFKARKIPNLLICAGFFCGIFVGFTEGRTGDALAGAAVGLILLLPLYWLRAMSAGDVKLMAMTGLFLGVGGAVAAVLYTFAAGGLLAAAVIARRQSWNREMSAGICAMPTSGVAHWRAFDDGALPKEAARGGGLAGLPYALAIAAGTVAALLV
jgi:prepilin peptidase CpaA